MAKRKTFDVEAFRNQINSRLANSTCTPDIRMGYCMALEHVLHETGNYRGFNYLDASQVPECEAPGIIGVRDEHGCWQPHPDYEKRFKETDETRRHYH